ncbi:hypothetical protein LEP1GSC041_2960 [Leptospira noguchii str. 2006001870]|uniref:Uncharacterized protein n=1 Tax=Leptospira noguchii serovar Autumnalis str. ZUN142 TaxID=1085540 RepID=M6UI87_9LEPT|nr:hypothetical protein LEP1GSC041_2960 [Leptospira noguchii str. 2006001870]EMO40794.1 hypothetical protein LEP1GSC186_0683 [Leptospira noguchii serovar Autumnalis str. ZUN142]
MKLLVSFFKKINFIKSKLQPPHKIKFKIHFIKIPKTNKQKTILS